MNAVNSSIPPEWRWVKKLRVGDVVKMENGRLRVVRRVDHLGESLSKTLVTFVIARKSWTTRPYTVLNGHDLKLAGYKKTKARYPLDTRFDKLIAEDIARSNPNYADCHFRACDVIGIP